jgi:rare lipoprotein A
MANGQRLDDEALTCASWDYKFGTRLRIRNTANNKEVLVVVTDRGPNRKLYRQGRKIDLSYEAMRRLNGIKQGVIPIEIEELK